MAMLKLDLRPGRKTLRDFGLISVAALGAMGAWAWFRHGLMFWSMSAGNAACVATVLWALAAAAGLAALTAPSALAPLYVALMLVAFPVGLAVSHVVVAVFFLLVVTPTGLMLRVAGRDPLTREFEREAASYWDARPPAAAAGRYLRQY